MVHNGIKPIKKDHRQYSYHRTFGSTLAIPAEFNLDPGLTMPDQEVDGLHLGCTGYTLAEICQDRDKIIYKPRYSYDKTLIIEGINPGDPRFEKVGVSDVRNSLKSGIIYGVQAINETTDEEAEKHRIGNYYDALDGSGLDAFDSIRSAMWKENKSIYVGTPWLATWSTTNQGVISESIIQPTDSTPWHAWKICGVKVINGQAYLIGKTWQGTGWGDGGWAYFPRSVINTVFKINGTAAFVWVPYSGQTINTVKLNIIQLALSWLRSLLTKSTPVVQVQTIPTEELLWDTPEHVRHSVRVMCDDANLTYSHTYDPNVSDKNILCACVEQESNFNTKATHPNKNSKGKVTSTDWGIVQVNDYFHIGEGKDFPSADYVLTHPQACVAWMIQMFKEGKATLWSSFTSGAYKKWL